MRRLASVFILGAFLIIVSACAVPSQPPQLLSEVTLAPGATGALIVPSASPTWTATPVPPSDTPTQIPSPTDTPLERTLPPSLTPRPTHTDTPLPTLTPTPTVTPTPTRTPRPTLTPRFSPTPRTPTPLPCTDRWFFTPRPFNCPMSAYTAGPAVSQQFEHGLMIWFGAERVIFVVYDATTRPRWQQFADTWAPDAPESDPSLAPPDGMFQPVRGFGLVWRSNARVRQRLGWATKPEVSYQSALQLDTLGNRFIRGPQNEVYQLNGDLANWQVITPRN